MSAPNCIFRGTQAEMFTHTRPAGLAPSNGRDRTSCNRPCRPTLRTFPPASITQRLRHRDLQGKAWASLQASSSSALEHETTLDRQDGAQTKSRQGSTDAVTLEEPLMNGQTATFDWERQWYPLAFVEDLDPKVPTPVQLLGVRLVLWRDAAQQWRCFEDKCPHRLAPLSEGRIEPSDGTLMCSYHGWRFQGDGKCTLVPQALDEKANAAACASSRSCASSRPTQALQGKVWVWGQGGPSAESDSAAVKPALIPELRKQWPPTGHDGQPWEFFAAQYMRDLPYGWSTLMENILDPSHVNFAHHNVVGSREDPQWLGVERIDGPPEGMPWPEDSFQMAVTQHDYHAKRQETFNVAFAPPCHARWGLAAYQEGGRAGIMPMYAVPSAPGQCKFLFSMLYPCAAMPWVIRAMMAVMPRAHKHIAFVARVLDGDSALLHAQEVIALDHAASSSPDCRKLYYMPAQADRIVTAFRAWLSGRGAGGPVPIKGTKELLPEHELLNHYEQHVCHCPSCSKALMVLERARTALAAAGALCMLALSAALGRGTLLRSPAVVGLATGAAVALAVWTALGPYTQRFKFVPYDHSA